MDARTDELRRKSAEAPGVIALGGGLPAAEAFPRADLASAFEAAIRDDDALQYGWPEGRRRLRAAIAARLRARGADVDADDVVITSGAQQAIAIAVGRICSDGDRIATGPESYPAALDLFRARGIAPSEAVDDCRAIYAMPAISNPHGRAFDASERAASLDSGIPILEDDAYADVVFDGIVRDPLIASARDRVWNVGSFSKTLAPGLRVGYLVPPRPRLQEVYEQKYVHDLHANSLAQSLVESYLAASDYDAHLHRIRALYALRAEALADALRACIPSFRFAMPEGGFSIWVETDDEGDETELLERAIEHGTVFDPGREFAARPQGGPMRLRLSFASLSEDRLREGIRRLARAHREYGRRRRRA